jgi:hypothetical protein
MRATFKNPKTGELKEVKVGFSWTLLFFSSVLGIPLFLRKLNLWGGIFVLLWVLNFVASYLIADEAASGLAFCAIFLTTLILMIWLAIKGNEMTAKNLLELGWEFADASSDTTRYAKGKWGITI